jgi:metal-dependent amidase/aminoacylase/carboxypeptidase family protein
VEIKKGYPYLVNHEQLTESAKKAAIKFLGEENVVELRARMTAEDFSRYSQLMPACFYRLGTGNAENEVNAGLHSPTFDVDESSMEIGAGLMAWIALSELKANQ